MSKIDPARMYVPDDRKKRQLGLRLHQAREWAGLTLKQAAHKLGLQAKTLQRYEETGVALAYAELIPFQDCYDVRRPWLAGLTERLPVLVQHYLKGKAEQTGESYLELRDQWLAQVGPESPN